MFQVDKALTEQTYHKVSSSGADTYRVPLLGGGDKFDLTKVADNFTVGFAESSDLTYFEDRTGLVHVEFDTNIPWVIDKALETAG